MPVVKAHFVESRYVSVKENWRAEYHYVQMYVSDDVLKSAALSLQEGFEHTCYFNINNTLYRAVERAQYGENVGLIDRIKRLQEQAEKEEDKIG